MRIRAKSIFRDHWSTFRYYDSQRKGRPWGKILLYTLFPALLAILFLLAKIYFTSSTIAIGITALSIFGGFLFNLQAIVFAFLDRLENSIQQEKNARIKAQKEQFLKEIHMNISYEILLTVLAILMMTICLVDPKQMLEIELLAFPKEWESWLEPVNLWIFRVLNFFAYFLVISFILTLLMVLSKVHILFKREISEGKEEFGYSQ